MPIELESLISLLRQIRVKKETVRVHPTKGTKDQLRKLEDKLNDILNEVEQIELI